MTAPTAAVAGPFCLRSLKKNAVSQTCVPAATLSGKRISTTGREVLPSYVNARTSAGASGPTNDITVAPSTPAGIALRVGCAGSDRRIVTSRPLTETTVIPGANAGTGCGV